MTDLNINSNRSQTSGGISSGETIVIRKGGHRASVTDEIVKSNANYVEEHIQPAEYPTLDTPDYSAKSGVPPQKTAAPKQTFEQNFNTALNDADFSQEDLGNLAPSEAKSQIAYALNHPGVKLDPRVTQLYNKLMSQVTEQTRDQIGDPNWTYEVPAATSDEVNSAFSDNFSTLLDQSKLSDADKKALLYTHYNPWTSSSLKENLQQTFTQLSGQAETQTEGEFNLNSDQSLTADNSEYNAGMNQAYEDAFRELTKGVKDEKTRAAVMTLFYHPDAQVPNKAAAQDFLGRLQQQAANQTAKEFNLPPGVALKPSGGEAYDAMIKDAWPKAFSDTTSLFAVGKLGGDAIRFADQIAKLGIGPHTGLAPPELQAAYNLARNVAIGKMKQDFGLPNDWSPENDSLGKLSGEDEEVTTGSSEGTSETDEAWNAAAMNDDVVNKVKYGIPGIGMEEDVASRDYSMAMNFLNFTQGQVDGMSDFAKRFLVGGDQISILDAMGAVSAGLSELRQSIYICQMRETVAAKAITRMQQSIQQDKIRLDEIERKKAEDKAKKKPFALFKIIQKIMPGIGKLIVEWMKYFLWTVDTLTGGLVGMIQQAAGLEPLTSNPLQKMGLISEAQAKKMDMVLQIIVMVIEMVVSILLAQPQLVALLVARTVELVAETCAKVAVKVAVQVARQAAREAIKAGVKEGLQEGVEAAVKEALKQGLKEAGETTIKTGSKSATKALKAVQSVADDWADNVAEKIAKQAIKEAKEEALQEGAEAGAKSGAEAAVKSAGKATGNVAADQAVQNAKTLQKLAEEMDEIYKESLKSLKKAARKAAGKAAVGTVLPNLQYANDIIQGLGQIVGHVIQIPQHLKQARKVRQLAALRAKSVEITANLEATKKASTTVLESIGDLGKWIDQINKQQSSYWQKSAIHFIVA